MATSLGLERLPSVGRGMRSGSMRDWVRPDDAFARASQARRRDSEDDQEALQWAALEKLPTYDRLRTTIFENLKGSKKELLQLDLKDMSRAHNQYLIQKMFQMNPEEDNEKFLARLRSRIDRVGIELPKVEVRYENLSVDAQVQIGGRALPTLYNSVLGIGEMILQRLRIFRPTKRELKILDNVFGIIKPGRMTLLLGPPGAGKTTLLLALAGQLDPNLQVSGTITYNGHTLDEFKPRKTAAYISQTDLHLADLTVRETLQFSARYQGIGSNYDLLTELLKREKELGIQPEADIDTFMKAVSTTGVAHEIVTEYIMKILGLDVCADTLVGDQTVRGISGGQKKRVTTGEMLVGPVKALFMDEISTGLDSSTTYQIIKCLGQFAHVLESSIFISLLQPAPETYDLFDDLVLLSDGQLVYHGPRNQVLEFIESVGFRCPARKGIADFLQEVTSRKDQEQYWSDKSKPYRFISVGEFNEAFRKFHLGEEMQEELKTPYDKSKSHKAALVFNDWSLPKRDLFRITFDKEWTLLKRSSFIHVFTSTQLALQALIAVSAFFRTRMHHRNIDDAQMMSGAIFFSIVSVMFNGFAELTNTVGRLPVFYKHRRLRFFPAWAFSLSTLVLRMPFAVIESCVWTSIFYYPVGMASNAGRFFRQLLLLILAHTMTSGLFRMVAGLSRTLVIANSLGSMTLLAVFVLGGFVLPRQRIRKWWIWGYYINPLSYAMNGVAVNEFLAPQWRKPSRIPGDHHTLGIKYLRNAGFFPRGFWYWLADGVMIAAAFIFTVVFTIAITCSPGLENKNVGMSEESFAEREANRTGQVYQIGAPHGEKKTIKPVRAIKSLIPRYLTTASDSMMKSQSDLGSGSGRLKAAANPSGAGEIQLSQQAGSEASTSTSGREFAPAPPPPSSGAVIPGGRKGMVLPFQPLAISFSDINYYVDMPAAMREATGDAAGVKLQLLRDITGSFRPGVLTALMGVTGAGKSTLMDVLAGRKTKGVIEGDIRISGYPKNQETFARISGYCEQNDIHSPQVTVQESLIFSAWLRLSRDVDPDVKSQFVQEVMELVELVPLKDSLVGLPGETGLSTEQRKRLTIAVELVANPSIIFMDEPTSGLDARAAAIVMRTVRNTVDTGRTVVCTIHQPSIDNFEAFDELLLLKRGGQIVYAGPLGRNSCSLVEYFEAIPGVPRIKDGYNPAAWMLDVTSPGTENKLGVDFAEIYRNSDLFQSNKALVEEMSIPAPNTEELYFPERYSQPLWVQFKYNLWKKHWTYWRSPDYNVLRFALALLSGLFFGTMFWRIGHNTNSQANLFAIMGSIYSSQLFIGVQYSSSVQPLVATERTVFYRERSAGMYSAVTYALSQMIIEIPYILVTASVYAVITYAMINLQWQADKFFWYLYFLFMTQLYFTYYGITAVSLSPNALTAAIVSGFFYNIWNLFAGFFIPKPKLAPWWRWFYWINPISYTLYGCLVTQFGDMDDRYVTTSDNHVMTVKHFVREHFGFKHSFLPFISLMMLLFIMAFMVITIFAMRFLNYQSR